MNGDKHAYTDHRAIACTRMYTRANSIAPTYTHQAHLAWMWKEFRESYALLHDVFRVIREGKLGAFNVGPGPTLLAMTGTSTLYQAHKVMEILGFCHNAEILQYTTDRPELIYTVHDLNYFVGSPREVLIEVPNPASACLSLLTPTSTSTSTPAHSNGTLSRHSNS